ncbi:MAG: hypothetical protein IPH95_12680 [Candidatus Promineofilum sp.]|nr:hypothetical protein [Promineifilum sp.]
MAGVGRRVGLAGGGDVVAWTGVRCGGGGLRWAGVVRPRPGRLGLFDGRQDVGQGDGGHAAAVGRMWVAELSRTRWTLAAEIVVGQRVCAAARQSGYFADLKTLRPVRVPDKLREAWENDVSS